MYVPYFDDNYRLKSKKSKLIKYYFITKKICHKNVWLNTAYIYLYLQLLNSEEVETHAYTCKLNYQYRYVHV